MGKITNALKKAAEDRMDRIDRKATIITLGEMNR